MPQRFVPRFGVQFHPEKNAFEHGEELSWPKRIEALYIYIYLFIYLYGNNI